MTVIAPGIGIPFGNQQGFSPFAIGRPFILLDAAKGITFNGGDISAWADQSGEGNDVAQATAADQPLYIASDSDFNNKPSIEADGITEFMLRATFVGGNRVQPNTIFTAYKFGDNVGEQILYDGPGTGRHLFKGNGAPEVIFAGAGDQNIHTADTLAHVNAILFNGAASNAWRDGIISTPAGNPGTNSLNGIHLWASFVPSSFANAKIAFFMIYPFILSDIQRNYVGKGLAGMFGTPDGWS